jgi:hypothetical protein
MELEHGVVTLENEAKMTSPNTALMETVVNFQVL